MKKLSYLVVALVAVLFTACGGSGNDPESPKNINYLPELTQKLVNQPLQTVQETLTKEDFTLEDEEEGNYGYFKAYDGADTKNGYSIFFWTESNTVDNIFAGQTLSSRAKAKDFTTSWSKYINAQQTAPTLWVGMIQDGSKDINLYMEGAILTTLKTALQAALALGHIDQTDYQEILEELGKTKADFQTDIDALDITKDKTGCMEVVITTKSLMSQEGKVNGYAYGSMNDIVLDEDGNSTYDYITYIVADGNIEEYLGMFGLEDLLYMIEELSEWN